MKLIFTPQNSFNASSFCKWTLNYNIFSKLFQPEIPRLSGRTLASWTLTDSRFAVLADRVPISANEYLKNNGILKTQCALQ
jgi:hypothetical protein